MAMSGASPNHSSKPGVSSPWSQIVTTSPPSSPLPATAVVEPSLVVAGNFVLAEEPGPFPDSFYNGVGHNGNYGKKLAWNKPSNGASSEVKLVMCADSWPALSESTRAPAKSPWPLPLESSKGLMDASSVPQLQGTGTTLSSPQKQVTDNASTNNMMPTHQKSFKRSNSNLSSNGSHQPLQSAPQGSVATTGSHNYSSKDHRPRGGFVFSDHSQQRNSFRNRNDSPHHRGDGAHHHSYGSRHDQHCGNQDWNTHRKFHGRDNYMSPRFIPRFIRPPPPPNSFQLFPPLTPLRHFSGSIGFPDIQPPVVYVPPPSLDSLRAVPLVPPIPPHVFLQTPDLRLHTKIVNQIDYYFSNENLIKDIYLRQNMDDQGWVPINLIAGFKKVMHLTDNIQIVLDAVRTSSVVEVQGDKIRRRNDWSRWIMPPVQFPNVTGSQTLGMLAEQVQSIALETLNYDGAGGLDASQNIPFGDLNGQFLPATNEGIGQVGIQVSDHTISARN